MSIDYEAKYDFSDFEGSFKEMVYALAIRALASKRPFGNSGFEYFIASVLCENGEIKHEKNEIDYGNGDVEIDYEYSDADLAEKLKEIFANCLQIDPAGLKAPEFY